MLYLQLVYIFSAQERPASKITKYFIIYFAPAIDTMFLIFATIVYSYIFSKLYKNKKKEEALRKQITVNKQYGPIVFKVARFSVPFCIALALVLYVIFPNILEIVKKIFSLHLKREKHFQMLSYVLYRIGFITDPIIYIHNLHVVQYKSRRFQKNLLNQIKRYLWKNVMCNIKRKTVKLKNNSYDILIVNTLGVKFLYVIYKREMELLLPVFIGDEMLVYFSFKNLYWWTNINDGRQLWLEIKIGKVSLG